MKIQHRYEGNVTIVELEGDFDAFAGPLFTKKMIRLLSTSAKIVLNLRLLMFVNTPAVGNILEARKKAREAGGDLVLSELSQRTREALDLLGLSFLFDIFSGDREAVNYFQSALFEERVRTAQGSP